MLLLSKKHSLLIQLVLYSSGKSSTYSTLRKHALSTRKSSGVAQTWALVLEHLKLNSYYLSDSVLHIVDIKMNNMGS